MDYGKADIGRSQRAEFERGGPLPYDLVSKGMWSAVINLKTHKLLNWKPEYGSLYFQAKVCDSGTYFLLDKDKQVICKIAGYVPNGLIPEADDCGDYIRLRINHDGLIENWLEKADFSEFTVQAASPS